MCITISQAAKRGFASRPTLYRAIKDGWLTAVLEGDKKTLDLADLVTVDRLRLERDQAHREAGEERDQARQERDRLLGLVEAIALARPGCCRRHLARTAEKA